MAAHHRGGSRDVTGRPAPGARARGRSAAGRLAPGQQPGNRRRRGTDRGRAAQPGRGELPPARHQARGDGAAVRAEVLDDHPYPRQDAEPGHRLGRHADRHRRGGRAALPARAQAVGDRVATLVSLTLTPLAITDGLAALGRTQRAGAGGRPRDPVRPLDRRGAARRPATRSWRSPCSTSAAHRR